MLFRFDGREPVVEEGAYVSETAQVIGDVVIGKGSYVGHGAILRGDYGRIEIGEGTAVEEGVIVHAPPQGVNRIGTQVTIGHGAVVHGNLIGDFSVIGMGAVTSIWSEIGSWTIVAEGAIVKLKQVLPDQVVVAGNPAAIVRDVTEKDQELWNWGKKIYIDLAQKYLDVGMERIDA
ncbi:MAG: gamma carbonic anhydrase family protein [Desulfobacterales bacterium]|nr:gamma carbonic anhydrase family protein [Desulfobacterales bacterium]